MIHLSKKTFFKGIHPFASPFSIVFNRLQPFSTVFTKFSLMLLSTHAELGGSFQKDGFLIVVDVSMLSKQPKMRLTITLEGCISNVVEEAGVGSSINKALFILIFVSCSCLCIFLLKSILYS